MNNVSKNYTFRELVMEFEKFHKKLFDDIEDEIDDRHDRKIFDSLLQGRSLEVPDHKSIVSPGCGRKVR